MADVILEHFDLRKKTIYMRVAGSPQPRKIIQVSSPVYDKGFLERFAQVCYERGYEDAKKER